MAESTFNRKNYARLFATLRATPPEAMSIYLDSILASIPAPKQIIDIGAGTGQFTAAFATACPNAAIRAVEPYPAMAAMLRQNIERLGLVNASVQQCSLDELDAGAGADLIILSEVVHLMDPLTLVERLVNMIGRDGCIAIRTSSQEQLRHRDWYRFFPRARLIDLRRHPSLDLLGEAFRYHGLRVSTAIVDESRVMPAADFSRLFRERMYSTLDFLSDDEFTAGCARAESELRDVTTYFYDYEMTLLQAWRPHVRTVH